MASAQGDDISGQYRDAGAAQVPQRFGDDVLARRGHAAAGKASTKYIGRAERTVVFGLP